MNRPYMAQYAENLSIDMFKNEDTLNIFSDASMRTVKKSTHTLASCYGAVAVHKDQIIDEMFRIQSISTVPAAEIRGIRCSLALALKWRSKFRVINIFSDSQISVFGLRDYIYNWRYNQNTHKYYLGKHGQSNEVKNQELFIECFQMLQELSRTNIVNIFHQSGHVESGFDSIRNAADVFSKSNGIIGTVSYEIIRYISVYNNYVDNKSRSFIRTTNVFDNEYIDAIEFYPTGNLYINPLYQNRL